MKAVVDRIVQYANRYQLTNVSTGEALGTFDFDEVTGTVQQVGTEIDAELFQSIADDIAERVVSNGGELSGTIVTFSDISGTAANVASGDTSATLWGKVKNWFSRMKALAFKDKVSNTDVADDAAIAQSKISGLSDALAKKQPTITGAATSITNNNLTESRAVISDANGKVAVSQVTETELGYLDGVTENIQTQIDEIEDGTTTVGEAEHAKKNDYNLGAYDTYVDNGDGTVTVTRKTGRYDVPINNFVVLGDHFEQSISLPNGSSLSYATDTGYNPNATSNVYKLGFYGLDKSFYVSGDNWLRVFDSSYTKDATGLAQFKAALEAAGGMYILYETTTSFTEKLAVNVPINTLDANMSDMVREEVEKTLNLFDINSRDVRTFEGATYSISGNSITVTIGNVLYSRVIFPFTTRAGTVYRMTCKATSTVRIVLVDGLTDDGEILFDSESNQKDEYDITFTAISGNTQLLLYSHPGTPVTFTDIMISEGSRAYPYVPYSGQIVHQGDPDMEFATSEWEKTLNLFDINSRDVRTFEEATYSISGNSITVTIGNVSYSRVIFPFTTRAGTVYRMTCKATSTVRIVLVDGLTDDGEILFDSESNQKDEYDITFTAISGNTQLLLYSHPGTPVTFTDIMISEGSRAYPYVPYSGQIVHEKDLNETLTTLTYIPYSAAIDATDDNPEYLDADDPWLLTHAYIGSMHNDGVWGNLINVRHRGGQGDGNNYGLQIAEDFGMGTLKFRYQNAGAWSNWIALANQDWVQDNYLPLTGGTINGAQNLKIQVQDSSWQDGIVLMESPSGAAKIFFNQEGVSGQSGVKAYLGVADGTDPRAGTLFFSANRNTQLNGLVYIDSNNYLYELGERVYSPNNPPPYPVTSVNGKTGDVSTGRYEHHIRVNGSSVSTGNMGEAYFTIRNNYSGQYTTQTQVANALIDQDSTGIGSSIMASGYLRQYSSNVLSGSGNIYAVFALGGYLTFRWGVDGTIAVQRFSSISSSNGIIDTVIEA